jgi:hypothetical protein
MSNTRNSNLPSRAADPAGAAVGVAGSAGAVAARGRLDVLLELDADELDLLVSLLPHFPMTKRAMTMATTINATFPPLARFVVVVA